MLIEKGISENSIVAIKLTTGEELIGKMISQDEDAVKLKKPMAFLRMQQSIGLMPWMATPEPDAELSIPKKFIIVMVPCEKQISNQYIETTSGIKLAKTDLNV